MDPKKIPEIWNKTDMLINDFKKYHLEKKISKVAIQSVQLQIQKIAEEKRRIEEDNQKSRQEKTVTEIETIAKDALTSELIASQIKETAVQRMQTQLQEIAAEEKGRFEEEEQQKQREEKAIIENIVTVATNALVSELMSSQIKETAIGAIEDKVVEEQQKQQKQREEKAIIENIVTVATNALASELMASQIKETAIRQLNIQLEEEQQKLQSAKKSLQENTIKENIETVATNSVTAELMASQIKETAIRELQSKVEEEQKKSNLQKELENIAINKVVESLPKVAEPKIDIKPLIENAAINKVKDALINDLKTKIAESETKLKSSIEANVKRDLEEFAIKTVSSATTGSAKTAPGSSTGPNIENDLKNTAIKALYSALLGVPRETREPIDITKPPTKFDILITDKTYKYDEKGERKEIPELTKYDRILAE